MATGAPQKKGTSARGFASMSPEQQRAIARKGGEAVSQNRAHMAAIGRKGGEATHARHSRAKDSPHTEYGDSHEQSAAPQSSELNDLSSEHQSPQTGSTGPSGDKNTGH